MCTKEIETSNAFAKKAPIQIAKIFQTQITWEDLRGII